MTNSHLFGRNAARRLPLADLQKGAVTHLQGWWRGDTNPLTGFELWDNGTGNISGGTCSLYGMN
jgi:hypothetical protein